MANFGYVQIEFEKEFKDSLVKWGQKSIDSKYFVYGKINGKITGGIVVQDAHITLSYGIPADTKYLQEIQQEIKKIILPKIIISSFEFFPLKEYSAKVLYLSVDDKDGTLEQINKKFKKFVSKDLQESLPFVPHITIAYVSEDFNEQAMSYEDQREVQATGIKYYQQ